MTTDHKGPKQFARMIRDYLKNLPEQYADDPKSVQEALALSDDDFKLGLDLLLERKIIVLDKIPEPPKVSTNSMEVRVIGGA
jgi:hypothetical protein